MVNERFEKDFMLAFNAAISRPENQALSGPSVAAGINWNYVDADCLIDMKSFGWSMTSRLVVDDFYDLFARTVDAYLDNAETV